MKVLEDLYYGRNIPWERRATQSAERLAVNRKIEDEKRYFMQKMSLDDCERFQKLDGLYSEAEGFEEIEAFSNGFKLGAQLMIETFANDKSICQDE